MDNPSGNKSSFLKRALQIGFGLIAFATVVAFLVPAQKPGAQPPDNRSEADKLSSWAYSNKVFAQQQVTKVLKDPDSARFQDVTVVKPKNFDPKRPGIVCGSVNAKNSFGGYTGFKDFVVIAGIPVLEDGTNDFVRLWNKQCAHKDAF